MGLPNCAARSRLPGNSAARLHIALAALVLVLSLLLAAAFPQHTLAAPSVAAPLHQESLVTRHFTIFYPTGERKAAEWYSSFIDDVTEGVSDLLGTDPPMGLTLQIYATESEYAQANPMAELHPGILAHAIPEKLEIGVAVERLRQQSPEVARESFRHEITHIVAGALSGQNLPVGFQEGLAQYNELSSTRSQEVVQALQAAQVAGKHYLSWADLNDTSVFRQNIDLAYPQSYSVMAFLADRYGMKPFVKFARELADSLSWPHALSDGYGKSVDALQDEWRAWLPGFLQDGWKHNVLRAYDLNEGLSLLNAGQFAQARDDFAESQKLYTDLGQPDKAQLATGYRSTADKAQAAQDLADAARRSLVAHDYAAALTQARQAADGFAALTLDAYRQRAADISQLAEQGLDAMATLDRAKAGAGLLDWSSAKADVLSAGQVLASLGDSGRVDEANSLLSSLAAWQQGASWLALALGGVVVAGSGLAVVGSRRRRARNRDAARTQLTEESGSWL